MRDLSSVRTRSARPVLLIGIAAIAIGCASKSLVGSGKNSFTEVQKHYQGYEPVRALALAVDAQGNWVYGIAEAELSDKRAKERALKACNEQRKARALGAQCQVYAVGPDVLWDGPTPD